MSKRGRRRAISEHTHHGKLNTTASEILRHTCTCQSSHGQGTSPHRSSTTLAKPKSVTLIRPSRVMRRFCVSTNVAKTKKGKMRQKATRAPLQSHLKYYFGNSTRLCCLAHFGAALYAASQRHPHIPPPIRTVLCSMRGYSRHVIARRNSFLPSDAIEASTAVNAELCYTHYDSVVVYDGCQKFAHTRHYR